jgi:tetratricopeptide (TPR) repeat protein
MAKRRLTANMREHLICLAHKNVAPKAELATLIAAYEKAERLVRALVEAKYPPAEMAILQKWDAAYIEQNPKVQFPNGIVQQFEYARESIHDPCWREGSPTPPLKAPKNYGQIYLTNEETAAAVEAWIRAFEAYKEERQKRLQAYEALIKNAKYAEDLIEVWPEATDALPKGSLPVHLGPEQVALVKADLEERKAA